MQVKKLTEQPTFDVMNDHYFFIAVATAIVMPMDEMEFVHADDEGFGLKKGCNGAALFKGEKLANKIAYELTQDNRPRKFQLIELRKS